MKSFEALAQSAYAAYFKKAQALDEEGLVGHVVAYPDLDDGEQQCWLAVAQQLWAEFAAMH